MNWVVILVVISAYNKLQFGGAFVVKARYNEFELLIQGKIHISYSLASCVKKVFPRDCYVPFGLKILTAYKVPTSCHELGDFIPF